MRVQRCHLNVAAKYRYHYYNKYSSELQHPVYTESQKCMVEATGKAKPLFFHTHTVDTGKLLTTGTVCLADH